MGRRSAAAATYRVNPSPKGRTACPEPRGDRVQRSEGASVSAESGAQFLVEPDIEVHGLVSRAVERADCAAGAATPCSCRLLKEHQGRRDISGAELPLPVPVHRLRGEIEPALEVGIRIRTGVAVLQRRVRGAVSSGTAAHESGEIHAQRLRDQEDRDEPDTATTDGETSVATALGDAATTAACIVVERHAPKLVSRHSLWVAVNTLLTSKGYSSP